ncbi:MAG TPA: IS21 family transposase, partial [Candidatus Binatia bacterium]|nr:IS21 family transposase [Candidatus Binatia bacterium]
EEEKPYLLPLPTNPFNTDLVLSIRSGKTIYVRFDLNDYSIPPTFVGRPLTLLASGTTVRILDGQTEVARHRRSYDRHEFVADPAHEIALLKSKRKARGSTPGGSLASAVPESEEFLNAAFQRGESAASQTAQLLRLLDDYGATELRAAISEALERNTPRASSVAFILNKRRRASRRRPPTPVDLSRRPDLADVNIQPHNPETYDELSRNDDDDSEQ